MRKRLMNKQSKLLGAKQMRFGILLLLLVWFIGFSNQINAKEIVCVSNSEHLKWLDDRVKEARSIKAGMSYAELLILFEPEGGFGVQTQPAKRYILKSCPLICVEITFDVDEGKASTSKKTNLNDLRIQHISPLYLDYTVSD
jgi:hypothetical protein